MENAVHVRDAQFLQVSSEKAYFVKRLHKLMREKKMLTTDLQQAKRNICLLNRKCNSQVMYHKVIPDNNLAVESDGDTATIRDERYVYLLPAHMYLHHMYVLACPSMYTHTQAHVNTFKEPTAATRHQTLTSSLGHTHTYHTHKHM